MTALLRVMTEAERWGSIQAAQRHYIGGRPMPDVFDMTAWPFGFYGITHNTRTYGSLPRAVWAWCCDEFGPAMQLHQPPRHQRRRDRHTWEIQGEGTILMRDHAQAIAVRLRWC